MRRNHKKNVTVRNPCSYRKNIRNIATKGCAWHIFAYIKRPGRPDQTRNKNWKVGEKMGEVIVSMKDIVKTFPGVKALDHVNFELRSGEVMALLGENGAGKSTLMKILSGVYTKDSGTMTIFGTEYDNLTPKQAQDVGVAIIHQELNMCRHLSVAENMFLGREKVNGIVLNDREMEAEAAKILGDLKIDIDPRQTVGDLPVSKQQMVEIAKALSIHAKILIMDEPTRGIDVGAKYEIYQIMIDLVKQGKSIIMISSEMPELIGMSNRIIVMCNGHITGEVEGEDATQEKIMSFATKFTLSGKENK